MLVKATPTERLPCNFQRLIQVAVSIKCISQNFYVGDLRSGQFCDLTASNLTLTLSIISQRETIEKHLFWIKTILNTLKRRISGRIGHLNRKITTSDPSSWPQGHFRPGKVTGSFSAITLDKDNLWRWNHLRCVQNDDTDRLICRMTFSDQIMTLTLTLTWVKF